MRKIDLVGQKFGRLAVISEDGEQTRNGQYTWVCICDCGNTVVVPGYELRKGHTQSCGCLQKERTSKAKKTHGMRHSREYNIWSLMIARCTNPNCERYPNYGGRGITVCESWRDFAAFYKDMGPSPAGHSIERVDNDGNYTPDNCIWANDFTQAQNRRTRVDNKSGVPGVYWYTFKGINKWVSTITRDKKIYRLGYFEQLKDAIEAREKMKAVLDSRSLSDTSNCSQQSAA